MEVLQDAFVSDLVKKQKSFFSGGETLSFQYRIAQLEKLRSAIFAYRSELETALTKDLGKSRTESWYSEIGFVLAGISHAEKHLKRWMAVRRAKSPITVFPAKSYVVRQPLGCVLIIGPYNYPFQLLMEPLTAAIAAGNCAALSPSELTPTVSAVVKRLVESTFENKYIWCSEGGAENNAALLRGRFDSIFFTGSARVGKIVMRAAAENLVPVTLELGGKSPVIVDETAKIKLAAERIAWGKFMNAGQTCVAPDYVFVQQSVYGGFIRELKDAIRRFYGEDAKSSPDYGRIVNERHMHRLGAMLSNDRRSVIYGGAVDEAERYIGPTVLSPPDAENAACMKEEIFGPLLPVFSYKDIREPLAYINAHDKPLALYIFSENKATVREILRKTSSGGVSVNDTISHIINPDLPFGGIGMSGMGRYHGEYGFLTFSHQRSVLERSTRIKQSLCFPPYTQKKYDTIRKFMK